MKIYLTCSSKYSKQMEQDKEALLKSTGERNVDLPLIVEEWRLIPNEKMSDLYAKSRYFKKEKGGMPEHGHIWFYEKYFKQEKWERRLMTFLHELIHIHLFSSEPKCYEWFVQVKKLEKERIEEEGANWITNYFYPMTLYLPLEMLAEGYFKQKYPDLFKTRTDVFYDLRVESENEFEKWRTNYKNKDYELVAPYVVYVELLKIGNFLKLISSRDSRNLKRFQQLYEKRKDQMRELTNSEQMEYFDRKEARLIDVSLEPLDFSENAIRDLATRF